MPADYKSQRSRIYGSHTFGVNQQKDLPPVEDDHKRVVSAASTVSNNLGGSEYWEHENVRLRGYLKEKDNLIIKLKEENAVLKQSERRHQKEIDALEHRNTEAPMMIKALRNEITGLKQKLKSLYIQQTSDDRNLRYQGEQIRQLKEQKAHLEMLVADQDLQLRDTLTKQLEAARNKMKEKDEEIMVRCRKPTLSEIFRHIRLD
ncbi:ciliary protein causing Leber congenital amaurosis disease-domain-containing protein [Paraphysoderma sedebokerense]|nr:ciliary protein causing Leber congenital amaurosis disease-domain-containing protein [Paraphysoderma sedebokerense]